MAAGDRVHGQVQHGGEIEEEARGRLGLGAYDSDSLSVESGVWRLIHLHEVAFKKIGAMKMA